MKAICDLYCKNNGFLKISDRKPCFSNFWRLGRFLACFWLSWVRFGDVFGRSWALFGCSGDALGYSWALLGCSGGALEYLCGAFGQPWALLGCSGWLLAILGVFLGVFVGCSWAVLGCVLTWGSVLVCFGAALVSFACFSLPLLPLRDFGCLSLRFVFSLLACMSFDA